MHPEPLVEPNYWVVQGVRLTTFPVGLIDSESAADWWANVAGSPPEESTARPREGLLTEAGSVALDEGRDVQVQLTVLPVRAEWRIAPVQGGRGEQSDEADGNALDLESLGEFGRAADLIQVLSRRWWPMAPPLKRLAFGAVLIHAVDSVEQAYRELSRFVQYPFDREQMSDFLLQVNRPRLAQTTREELQINRLVRWSALAIQSVQLSVAGAQFGLGQTEERYAVRCELDINTSATRQDSLPADELPQLFDEIGSLAAEIARSGDIP